MGNAGLGGKYGNGRTHDPRCNCPDCNGAYVTHNTKAHCTCEYCVQHREIFAAPPRVTRPDEIEAEYRRVRQEEIQRSMGAREWKPPQRGKAKTVGNLNICIRPGCNAIIKGEAAGRVQLETNIGANGKSTLYVLCPPCTSDVDAVLNTEPTSDRERAYDKPYEGYKAPGSDDVDSMTDEQLAAKLFERMMAKTRRALESGSDSTD